MNDGVDLAIMSNEGSDLPRGRGAPLYVVAQRKWSNLREMEDGAACRDGKIHPPSAKVNGKFPTLIEDLEIRVGRADCCGRGAARALIQIRVCRRFSNDCEWVSRGIGLKFTCRKTCRAKNPQLVFERISDDRACPGCL